MPQTRIGHWDGVYREKPANTVSWFEPSPAQSLLALDRLGAKPSDAIIDIGGGSAPLVDALLDRGWTDITVMDISEAALANSRMRLAEQAQEVEWLTGDILAWEPARRRDIWHDRAVFHFFVDPVDRAAYRERVQTGLVKGGAAIIATFAPDGPEKCSGLPVQRYDGESLAAELGEDFTLVQCWEENHHTPGGAIQRFNWCIFRYC